MADKKKKTEAKLVLERTYVVPLRHEWLKVPMSKRGKKAVKALKEFLVRHMKVYDRDLRKIKVDIYLNNEIRFRGMRRPPAQIKVLAKKYDDGIVRVELADVPEYVKFLKLKHNKKYSKVEKKIKDKKEEEPKKETKEKEETVDTKEKEETSKEEGLKISKEQAIDQKHVSKDKKVVVHRRALSR
jgi:ribosomal protein L31E